MFIRALYAGLRAAQRRFGDAPIRVLYAGCGPYATLLLPLLHRFEPSALELTLLDIHQPSLNSVKQLLAHHGLGAHRVCTVRADACRYRHPRSLHLVIAETMQKALEQEPQFAVTANLAPQLHAGGWFLPERIHVELCLLEQRAACALPAGGRPLSLGRVLRLQPECAETHFFRIDCGHDKRSAFDKGTVGHRN